MDNMAGSLIVKINLAMTCLFVIASVMAAAAFSQPWKTIAVAVSLLCFAIGITVFLWGYWTAVQRSRTDEISVAAMYFLIDGSSTIICCKDLEFHFGGAGGRCDCHCYQSFKYGWKGGEHVGVWHPGADDGARIQRPVGVHLRHVLASATGRFDRGATSRVSERARLEP